MNFCVAADDAHGHLWVVVEGSTSLASWQTNFTFQPTTFEDAALDVRVHRGSYAAACDIYARVEDVVRRHVATHGPNAKIHVTGHSIGGSIATIIALQLVLRNVAPRESMRDVWTFGSPYVLCGGDALLARLGLPRTFLRSVTMGKDLVPRSFSCYYPQWARKMLESAPGAFKVPLGEQPSFLEEEMFYAPMGDMLLLQARVRVVACHVSLPATCRSSRDALLRSPRASSTARSLSYRIVFPTHADTPNASNPQAMHGSAHPLLPPGPGLYALAGEGLYEMLADRVAGEGSLGEGDEETWLDRKPGGGIVGAREWWGDGAEEESSSDESGGSSDDDDGDGSGGPGRILSPSVLFAPRSRVPGNRDDGRSDASDAAKKSKKSRKRRKKRRGAKRLDDGADARQLNRLACLTQSDAALTASLLLGSVDSDAIRAFSNSSSQNPNDDASTADDQIAALLQERGRDAAQRVLLNTPHPLTVLSDPRAYGNRGSISRHHNPFNYMRALGKARREWYEVGAEFEEEEEEEEEEDAAWYAR